MTRKRTKTPVDPNADLKRRAKSMPTSEIVIALAVMVVAGSEGPYKEILSAELDARVPAEHKYQERWPSDYNKVID